MNDAVVTFASAFNDNATFLRHIYPTSLDCAAENYWNDGEKIIENLNRVSSENVIRVWPIKRYSRRSHCRTLRLMA